MFWGAAAPKGKQQRSSPAVYSSLCSACVTVRNVAALKIWYSRTVPGGSLNGFLCQGAWLVDEMLCL